MQLSAAIRNKPEADKFQYRIAIPKRFEEVVSAKVSNRNLTASESQQVAASF